MNSPLRNLLPVLLATSTFAQQPDTLLHSIPAPPGAQSGAQLGSSVAVDGELTVAGAPLDDLGMQDTGAVKVFDTTTGALLHVIQNPSPGYQDRFGRSVAISGTRVVVGAYLDDTGAIDAGSAYVYDLASASPTTPVATLSASGGRFGYSMAISGTRLVVGSSGVASNAYVYDLASATPTVPVATLSNPSPASNNLFGWSVAISGSRVVVGAQWDDTGATEAGSAYVYDLASASPTAPMATLNNPSPAAGTFFSESLAISGTRVVVGATGGADADTGSAYVYDLASATPTVPVATLNDPSPAAFDGFGTSVAISGTRVVVGANADDTGAIDAGSAYAYDLASATPTVPVATLNNPGPELGGSFGSSVAISGTYGVVGAPNGDSGALASGGAYAYDLASATPILPVATLNNPSPVASDHFGRSVAISGTRVVVGADGDDTGATDAGSAYVYDLASATPTVPAVTLNNPGPAASDFFGISVAISGTRVVVGASGNDAGPGANNAGSAYVYNLSSATPTVPAATLNNPGPAANDFFGRAVAISGMRAVMGASGDDTGATDAGSAYVYNLGSATPTVPVATLNNPGPAANDNFGSSVAISGTRVVVGAYRDDTGATDAGSAYVYDLASATPTVPVTTLNNPSPAANDNFGYSVAISGTRVVVSVYQDDTGATNAGSAYVYDLSSATPTVPVATLNNPSPAFFDQFGISVAIDGTTAVAGALDAAYIFAPADPDYDHDGLFDIWEYARFGSITAHTATDDSDGDGRVELLEQAFGSDPLLPDAASAPRPVSESGFLTITIAKRAGVNYTVETAGNPSGADFSAGTTTIMTNTASTLKVRDNFTPATAALRFMRVNVNPSP